MTEHDWLTSEDPEAMLRLMTVGPHPVSPGARASDRQLRLFACACCRFMEPHYHDRRGVLEAVREGEEIADGLAARRYTGWYVHNPDAALAARMAIEEMNQDHLHPVQRFGPALLRDILNPFRPVTVNPAWLTWRDGIVVKLAQTAYDERERACDECVDGDVGCPECEGGGIYYDPPYSLNRLKCPHCNDGLLPDKCKKCSGTGTIEDGTLDPDRLAVLADALEEAGCADEAILRHLRKPVQCSRGPDCAPHFDPHVRGCWALDLLLGHS